MLSIHVRRDRHSPTQYKVKTFTRSVRHKESMTATTSGKHAEQQLCKCSTLSCTFLLPSLHNYYVKTLNFTFYGGRNQTATFLPVSKLGISAPGEFACSWQSKWVGITAMKIKKKTTNVSDAVEVALPRNVTNLAKLLALYVYINGLYCMIFNLRGNWRSSGTSENGVTYCFFLVGRGWGGGGLGKVSAGHKFLCRKNGLWHAEYYIFSCMYLLMDMRRPSTPTVWPLEST